MLAIWNDVLLPEIPEFVKLRRMTRRNPKSCE